MSNRGIRRSATLRDHNPFSEVILYTTPEGDVRVEVFLKDENIWLTQEKISHIFGVQRPAVTKHIKNIFEDGELQEEAVCSILEHTAEDGKRYQTGFYNLDAIIAVGYRVNSRRAIQFRVWATQILKEYIIKGFAMNDARLKDPQHTFGKDYFEEQLARIRDIRSSERRLYQKITDIYAKCSADYDSMNDITKQFYATVQNKLHFAMTGRTAAEIIAERVNHAKSNLGLTNWKNAPQGAIREADVSIAKNYLNKEELEGLNRIVTMYLDYAEMQARQGIVMYMDDWVMKLNAFLQFNAQNVLEDTGAVSHEVAKALALREYEFFRLQEDRDYLSDFDQQIQASEEKKKEEE